MLFFVTQTMLMKHKIIDSNYSTCRKSKTEMCNQILFRKTILWLLAVCFLLVMFVNDSDGQYRDYTYRNARDYQYDDDDYDEDYDKSGKCLIMYIVMHHLKSLRIILTIT